MTVLDHPRPTWNPRVPRRHEIVATGGMEGVLRVGDALRTAGFPVRDFAVDVRDGVSCSSITCTVSLSSAEAAVFAQRVARCPSVVSVELR